MKLKESKSYQPRGNSAPENNRRVKSGVTVSGARPVLLRIERGRILGVMMYVDGILP